MKDATTYQFTPEDKKTLDAAASILEKAAKYTPVKIGGQHEATRFVQAKLVAKHSEVFAVLYLNNQNQLIQYKEEFHGTIAQSAVYPRVIAKHALDLNAAAIIAAHNHPSGDPEPSLADINITKRIKEAVGLFDIRLLDHIIVGLTSISLAERGQI